ncbi:MAG: response regulator [Elusimicrobia bacterium]|nr:response regulator [Elusimicrobiota bacterium]
MEDSPVMRLMLQEMLEAQGHQIVAQADSAASALKAYRETKPQLVTLDISLPDKDGFAALKELRHSDPSAAVVIITGSNQEKIEAQARSMKALGILHKPFDQNELAALMEQVSAALSKRKWKY